MPFLNQKTYDYTTHRFTAAGISDIQSWISANGNYPCPNCLHHGWDINEEFGVIGSVHFSPSGGMISPGAGFVIILAKCKHCRQVVTYAAHDVFSNI